jgi:hypothetical protein
MKGQAADAHLERQVMGRKVVVAASDGRLVFHVGVHLLRRVRRTPPETGAGQDHWGISLIVEPQHLDQLLDGSAGSDQVAEEDAGCL